MNAPLKNSMLTMFKSNLKILARSPICLALLFCLSRASLAGADAIYDFSLPANGAVSSVSLQLRFPNLLPAGELLTIPATSPVVTLSFPTPGFTPIGSAIALWVTPTATMVGLGFRDSSVLLLYTADFFAFSRTPLTTGAFASTSGEVVSSLALATPTPTANLTVSSVTVPEPVTALLLISGLSFGWCSLRRRSI